MMSADIESRKMGMAPANVGTSNALPCTADATPRDQRDS